MLLARCRPALLRATSRAYSAESKGPNDAILDMLKSNKEEEAQRPDKNPYKIRAFTSAIRVIDALDRPLRSATEAKSLKGIGPGIFRRLQDFFETTEKLEEPDSKILEQLKDERAARALLEQISGIGPIKARQLVAAGCMTIEQLRTSQYMEMLSNVQRIGVTYFHHIEERVSREEAEALAQNIRELISPKYELIVGGSYRRGAATSSDIDLILLHPDHVHVPFPAPPPNAFSGPATPKKTRARKGNGNGNGSRSSLLQSDVVPTLEARGILAATLSGGDLKWQGIALLPNVDPAEWGERQRRIDAIENGHGVYRRMDLNLVAQKSRGAALLALTGDTDFNRDLRIRAAKLGLHLNEFGLWRWNEDPAEDEVDEDPEEDAEADARGFWELVRAETEEAVLRELGMEYVEPTKRNYAALMKGASSRRKR